MSPTSYQTAPPRISIIATARGAVKPYHGENGDNCEALAVARFIAGQQESAIHQRCRIFWNHKATIGRKCLPTEDTGMSVLGRAAARLRFFGHSATANEILEREDALRVFRA
jgi:hypothetical protein